MSVLVSIVKHWTHPMDKNIGRIQRAFSSNYFITTIFDEPVPDNVTDVQSYLILGALSKAKNRYPHLPVIVIMDNSVTNVKDMERRISTALSSAPNAGLFYLTKWMDTCSAYSYIEDSIDNGSAFAWTKNPSGAQCILYMPSTRDSLITTLSSSDQSVSTILNTWVVQEKVRATTFVPNIVDFDIELATTTDQFLFLNECSNVPPQSTDNSALSVVYFIIAIGVVILFAWAFISLGPKN
jgi:hypothetical protein